MIKEIEITKDLQNAFLQCDPEICNCQCMASMSNGDCLFDYVRNMDENVMFEEEYDQ